MTLEDLHEFRRRRIRPAPRWRRACRQNPNTKVFAFRRVTGAPSSISLRPEAGISRSLMKMRPRKLEIAGIVVSALEAAAGGQAANFYEIVPFEFLLNPLGIAKGGPFHPPGFLHSTGESDG